MRKAAFLTLATAYALVISPPVWAISCNGLLRSWVEALFPPGSDLPLAEKIVFEGERGLNKASIFAREGHGPPERWMIDGPEHPRRSYGKAFSEIFRDLGVRPTERYFENLLRSKREAGLSAHVCDLMGSGYFIEDRASADSVTGLRWGAFRRESLEEYKTKKPVEVLGDIMHPQTWKNLDLSMRERGIPAFDLIVMRPQGGWEQAPWNATAAGNINALKVVIGQVLQRLSPEGHFYFEVSLPQFRGDISQHPLLKALVREIEERTRYKLVLHASISRLTTTYRLSGALLPKNWPDFVRAKRRPPNFGPLSPVGHSEI